MAKYKIGDRVIASCDERTTRGEIKEGCRGTIIHVTDYDVCVEFDTYIGGHSGNTNFFKGNRGHCWYLSYEGVRPLCDNKVVITTDGKETIARLYENDKVIKSAVAKCSPDDRFDFNTGAKIAFDRLMGEKPDEKWRVVNRPAKEGDYIRLKTPLTRGTFNFNKPGDIMRVTIGHKHGCKVRECDHPHSSESGVSADYLWNYLSYEYDVVEPVETPEEKPKYYNGKVVCVKKGKHSVYTVGKVYEFIKGKVKIDNGIIMPIGDGITTLDEWNKDPGLYCEFIPFVE